MVKLFVTLMEFQFCWCNVVREIAVALQLNTKIKVTREQTRPVTHRTFTMMTRE